MENFSSLPGLARPMSIKRDQGYDPLDDGSQILLNEVLVEVVVSAGTGVWTVYSEEARTTSKASLNDSPSSFT